MSCHLSFKLKVILVELFWIQNAALEAQVSNLQSQLTREQEEFEERLTMKDQEIADLRATIEEQSQEYADILEVKIKLDNEIATYRKLLETEEERYKHL